MKLKYHKICNVPMEVCTAEQKIAYNLATFYDFYGKRMREAEESKTFTTSAILEFVYDAIAEMLKDYQEQHGNKYNIDAIQCALNAGLQEFWRKPFIPLSYKEIGEAFPAYYL